MNLRVIMTKSWIITAKIVQTLESYGAYTNNDLEESFYDYEDVVANLEEELWCQFGYLYSDFNNEDEYEEAYDETREQFLSDLSYDIYECDEDEIKDLEIIIDERLH